MRIVYGAGAVAALSVLTVNLVQPSFGTSATEQPAAADAQSPAAVAASDPSVTVRHVTRYVQLKRGQRAPRGATVIRPGEVAATPPPKAPGNKSSANNPSTAAPNPTATKPPVTKPSTPTAKPADPAPAPTTKTRQSGRP